MTGPTGGLLLRVVFLSVLCLPGGALFGQTPENPRLILIKVDGVSDLVMKASVDPYGPESDRLPFPELFRQAHLDTRKALGREVLLPNLSEYFFVEGTPVDAIYSGTAPLSTPSWAVIDTGQPSIVKNQFLFNRSTGTLYRFLDQIEETRRLLRGAGKTSALWSLDLVGVPPLLDAFAPERRWSSLQFIVREAPLDQLAELGLYVATGGGESFDPAELALTHLRQTVYFPDITEQSERALARLAARVVLREDEEGREKYDLISLIFPTLDRQFHVNPDYWNILSWMAKLDEWVGTVLASVEQSRRRDQTLVALISDHGLDFDPVHLNYAFPITSWFREAAWGGHTNLSPTVENFAQDPRVPTRGLDFFTRIYESPHSPYGKRVPNGQDGYYTAFLANEGNPRFDAYLRHSDLNALHLLLLETLRLRNRPDPLRHLFPVYREKLRRLSPWVEEEAARFRAQIAAFERYRDHLLERGDGYSLDSAERISREIERATGTVQALDRLAGLPGRWEKWKPWVESGFHLPDLIPKGYFGIPNDVATLHRYVVGWREPPEKRWVDGPASFRRIDYPKLITEFRAANPNSYGNHHPFNFFAVHLPLEKVVVETERPLRQVVWLRFSQGRGEAVLLECLDGRVMLAPIRPLSPEASRYRLEKAFDSDPVDYGNLRFRWLTRHEWVEATGTLETVSLPSILTDMFRDNHRDFLGLPSFRRRIAERKGLEPEDHVRAVDHLFRQMVPDFRVWNHTGWNVNTRSHTPGGTHGGFTALENRIIFSLWAGADFRMPRGRSVPGSYLAQDIVPTLLEMIGMLDAEGRVVPGEGVVDGVHFPPPAGKVIPVREQLLEDELTVHDGSVARK